MYLLTYIIVVKERGSPSDQLLAWNRKPPSIASALELNITTVFI